MKRLRSSMGWVVCLVALFGLGWSQSAFSGQFPPKKMCFVTDPGDDLVFVGTCKRAGGRGDTSFTVLTG